MSSNGMKYVIFEGHAFDIPVIFATTVEHVTMAGLLKPLGKPLSAGFVDINEFGVSAHGRSVSLGIESRPEDTEIIERHMGQQRDPDF